MTDEAIQLSKLTRPVIPGLLRSPDDIAAGIIERLRAGGMEITAGGSDPASRIIGEFAHEMSNLRQQVQEAAEDLSLAYARGEALENIGITYYNVPRLPDEDDEHYRIRIAGTPDRFAVALSTQWYRQNALSVPNVLSALAITPSAGRVTIYIKAREFEEPFEGGFITRNSRNIPDAAQLKIISDKLTRDDIRQQTDLVAVLAGTPIDYRVEVLLTVAAEPDSALVTADAMEAFHALAEERSALGKEMNALIIAGAVVVGGVDDVEIAIFRINNDVESLVSKVGGGDNEFLRLDAAIIVT